MHSGLVRKAVLSFAILGLFSFQLQVARAQWAAPQAVSAFSIPPAQLIHVDELNGLLHARGADRPLILQVGSRMMFDQAHIPGSEYAGPGSQPDGTAQLRGRVASLPHSTFIVLYCGCCPWNRCPNVGPAYQLLREMGFTRVKVLYLANNFGADWVNKGLPVEGAR
ncbi:MAG TPA: rhodanese-like domain-containing protein [Terracidiphilus sp.]|nr:rhodanese-like domain-containing protein [Terracidiphilus sp.]